MIKIEPSWKNALDKELASDWFAKLAEFVRGEYAAGKQVYPRPENIFRAFNSTPFDKVRVVILGQDPYHGDVNGTPKAQGLSFSVPAEIKNPPSLQNIFKEIELDIGKKARAETEFHGDLSFWAEQGVLLLNTVLSVEKGKAGSHAGHGWEQLTADYSSTQNPNGAWTYGWALNRGAPINVYQVPNYVFCSLQTGWSRQFPQYPQVSKNETANTYCCSTVRLPPGEVVLHPGSSGENSVLRWTAPEAGYYFIEVGFGGVDHTFPTNSDVAVLRNLATLFSSQMYGYNGPATCQSNAFGLAHTWSQTLLLAIGDTIDCNVGFGQNQLFNGDSTLVQMHITKVTEAELIGGPCGGLIQYSTGLPFLGQNMNLGVGVTATNSFGLVNFAAGDPQPTPLFGCTLYPSLGNQIGSVTFLTSTTGSWGGQFAIPAGTGWHGFRMTTQALVLDTLAPQGVQLSAAIVLTL